MSFYNAGPSKQNAQDDLPDQLAAAVLCLRTGRNAQAFALLSAMETSAEPAAAFALALCYLRAGQTPAAIRHLEAALRLVRALPATPPNLSENSDVYNKLYQAQLEAERYLDPLDTDFCRRFPREAERVVLCALIHAYMQEGLKEQAKALSAKLNGPVFEAYKKGLFSDT